VLANNHKCLECGRTLKFMFSNPYYGTTIFELVQTDGPDCPAYLGVVRRMREFDPGRNR